MMRLENYAPAAVRLLERARDAHRSGARGRAADLRAEADGLIAQGAEALIAAQAEIAKLATESAVQAIEDDAWLAFVEQRRGAQISVGAA